MIPGIKISQAALDEAYGVPNCYSDVGVSGYYLFLGDSGRTVGAKVTAADLVWALNGCKGFLSAQKQERTHVIIDSALRIES